MRYLSGVRGLVLGLLVLTFSASWARAQEVVNLMMDTYEAAVAAGIGVTRAGAWGFNVDEVFHNFDYCSVATGLAVNSMSEYVVTFPEKVTVRTLSIYLETGSGGLRLLQVRGITDDGTAVTLANRNDSQLPDAELLGQWHTVSMNNPAPYGKYSIRLFQVGTSLSLRQMLMCGDRPSYIPIPPPVEPSGDDDDDDDDDEDPEEPRVFPEDFPEALEEALTTIRVEMRQGFTKVEAKLSEVVVQGEAAGEAATLAATDALWWDKFQGMSLGAIAGFLLLSFVWDFIRKGF